MNLEVEQTLKEEWTHWEQCGKPEGIYYCIKVARNNLHPFWLKPRLVLEAEQRNVWGQLSQGERDKAKEISQGGCVLSQLDMLHHHMNSLATLSSVLGSRQS